jgi:hypothetical protein
LYYRKAAIDLLSSAALRFIDRTVSDAAAKITIAGDRIGDARSFSMAEGVIGGKLHG